MPAEAGPKRPWHLEQSFKVQPHSGLCYAGKETCANRLDRSYTNVQALQLGHGGSSLLVLHSAGVLDAWDLEKGAFKGQLQLGQGKAYQAMCHDGGWLRLSRQSPSGPILEELPWASVRFA
ncbi:unnamed protein product [Symbiodinium pilosum]|uniref:Uncharacterized protein n=1 Tax=Symbiodinium pilosum TaxID=2952 RepID=A0A812R1Q3_SYMPI|nr:unnamed protein product [Symbiodinium pilosum]